MRIQKFSRPGVILMATGVVIITSMVVANATQTITTPNAVKITFNLAPNTDSAAITPASNTSVLAMGCCTTVGYQGVGQASLLHIPNTFIVWTGYDSFSPITFSGGFSSAPGAHIVYIDFNHQVDIQINSADAIRIHNGSAGTRAGNVTLIW